MRRSLTYIAWFCLALIIGIEVSSLAFISTNSTQDLPTPGIGIMTLALIDGVIFYSWSSIKLNSFLPGSARIPVTKISNFIFFLVMLIGAFVTLLAAIALLLLMISLIMAIPFGTIAYMLGYADFPKGAAQATLATIMTLKIIFAVLIVIGEARLFNDYRRFLMLLGCSFALNIAVSFLHGLVPGFLVSITDAIAAIVISVIALIWLLFLFVTSIPGMITLIIDALGLASKAVKH